MKRFLDHLLNVPVADADDARRRRLLTILLLCMVALTLVELLETRVIQTGLIRLPAAGEDIYLSVLVVLLSAAVIYIVNRYWSGYVASALFLFLLIVSSLYGAYDAPAEVVSGRSLLSFAVLIVMASVLLPPYASFIVAGAVGLVLLVVGVGIAGAGIEVISVILTFFLIALVSWIAGRGVNRALADLRAVNRELDQRVIERTRDLQRRSLQLQAASEVARDATGTLDVEELLDDTVRLISERFGFYHAGVFLLDERGEYAVLRAASSEGGRRMTDRGFRLAVGREGIVGHVAGSGERLVVLDTGENVAQFLNPDLPDTRAAMALPLSSRGRVIGVLDVQSMHRAIFTEEDVATLQTMADQLANAIESARLYAEARRHVEELTALHNIDVAMTSTLELDEVLRTIYEQVKSVMGVSTFYITLYDQRRDEIHAPLVVSEGEFLPPYTSKVEGNSGLAGWVVRHRQPLWVEDAEAEQDKMPSGAVIVGGAMRSLMVLPLIVRDQTVGVISAQSSEPRAFSQDDQRIFSGVAHQAAIAITNAQLYEEARRRLSEALLIQEVILAAASTLDFDLVLERTVKALHRALQIDSIQFLLPSGYEDALVIHPSLVGPAGSGADVPLKGSLAGHVYSTGQPMLVGTARQDAGYLELSAEVRSALAVPVWVGSRVVAVLRAESAQEAAFGEDALRIFTIVAGQLGVMLENARLYQEMTRHTRELRLLTEVSGGMLSSLEPQDIVNHLLGALVTRFQAPCGIALVEADGETVRLVAGWTPDGGSASSMPLEHETSISQWRGMAQMAETKQMLYIPDLEREERQPIPLSDEEWEAMRQHGMRAALFLPMLSQDRLVGITSLCFYEPLPEPADDQLGWAQTLVNQAAAALANAQLYQQLEAQAKELSSAYTELQEIDHLRAQLVQNISHELRTPTTLIKGYVELLVSGDLGRVLESQRAALQIIYERTAALSRLIQNLTVLQSLPREALALAPLSIIDVVKDVLMEFQRTAEKADITFCDDLPEGLHPVMGDQERLKLVFGHLVDNAIKFSPDGGDVTLRAWEEDGRVCVSVADQGIGIATEHLGRIFERFYQVDGSTTRRFGGMGIGLALVWEVVEAHGGSVQVESEAGGGSTFTVLLPCAEGV